MRSIFGSEPVPREKLPMFELHIPKKIGYYKHIQEVLETLFDFEKIVLLDIVDEYLDKLKKTRMELIEQLVKLAAMFQGYSIYEVDGRFMVNEKPVDERVLIVRFYFRGMPDAFNTEDIEKAIQVLIGDRLAELMPDEEEIWIVQHQYQCLHVFGNPKPPKPAQPNIDFQGVLDHYKDIQPK